MKSGSSLLKTNEKTNPHQVKIEPDSHRVKKNENKCYPLVGSHICQYDIANIIN